MTYLERLATLKEANELTLDEKDKAIKLIRSAIKDLEESKKLIVTSNINASRLAIDAYNKIADLRKITKKL